MCQKCGSYLRAALINVITVYIRVSIVFHKVFDEFHRIFQFFWKKSIQGIFDFINWIVGCQDISRGKILGKKDSWRKILLFLLKRRKKLYFWSFCCLWYFCNKWRCWLAGGVLHKYWFLWYFLTWSFVVSCDIFSQTINTRK